MYLFFQLPKGDVSNYLTDSKKQGKKQKTNGPALKQMGGGREKRHGCGSGVGASTVPGGPSVCGRGALADT